MVVSGGGAPIDRAVRRLAAWLRDLRRRGRIDARPAIVALILVLSSALVATVPSANPLDASRKGSAEQDEVAQGDAAAALDALWSAFPVSLDPVTAMGPAAHWLFETDGAPRLKDAPQDAAGLFGRVLDPAADRLPIPEAPEGPEPLLAALQAYAGAEGIDLGDLAVLRAQVTSLRLVPEAERALARLVLAYTQSVEVERQAMAGLATAERLLVDGDPATVAAWLAEEPTRTRADLDGTVQHILATRVDVQDRLRAADLLVRTIEEVKGPLALPPAPLGSLDVPPALPASASSASSASEAMAGDKAWDFLPQVVSAMASGQGPAVPPLPRESLPEALAGLATTLGIPQDTVDGLPSPDLPPSLADAVATIVTARRVGLESGDAGVHSLLLLQATRDAEPALRAWGALLALDTEGLGATLPTSHLPGIVRQTVSPAGASPSDLFAQAHGRALPTLQPPLPLATVLGHHGMDPSEASRAAASLPPGVATAIAMTVAAMDDLVAAREAGIPPGGHDALRQAPEMAGLLAKPQWSHDEARLMLAWAQAAAAAQEASPALLDAQAAAMAAVEAAVLAMRYPLVDPLAVPEGNSGPAKERSWLARAVAFVKGFQVIGTASAQPLPAAATCPVAVSPNCADDIWFYTGLGGGVLVTGYGESTIGPFGTGSLTYPIPPRLIIDLGGNDRYEVAAGAASASTPTSVVIDLGGDDHYVAQQAFAHGSAVGQGTLGVLWDADGDDHYEHLGAPGASNRGQGFGAAGGLGVLVDGGGWDLYDAPDSFGQGYGEGPALPEAPSQSSAPNYQAFAVALLVYPLAQGSTGILIDRGVGDDDFGASGGQGHAAGGGALGILINEQGVSKYHTGVRNGRFQGGPAAGAVGSVAGLVDLGGHGTAYSNPDVPAKRIFVLTHKDNPQDQRQDDAVWVLSAEFTGAVTAIGFGIDSTTGDEDDDRFHNLVELVAGSDPQDDQSVPSPGAALDLAESVAELAFGIVNDPPGVEELPGLLNQIAGTVIGALDVNDTVLVGEFHHFDRDARTCGADNETVNLLLLSDPQDKTITARAHILVDLGGNTTYTTEVAGPGDFCIRDGTGQASVHDLNFTGVGSYALDIGGNDHYDTPDMDGTQAAVAGQDHDPDQPGGPGQQLNRKPSDWVERTAPPVSMLINLQGDDVYEAGEKSQGSAFMDPYGVAGDTTCAAQRGQVGGAAWLIDLAGSDRYVAGATSHGSTLGRGMAALVDLDGDDTYTFDEQAVTRAPVGCTGNGNLPGNALMLDGAGQDHYHGQRQLSSNDLDEALDHQGFVTQSPLGSSALFMDLGPDLDVYTAIDASGVTRDISDLKNNGLVSSTQPPYAFADNPTSDFGPDDPDGDGAPNLIESLFFTALDDPESHPGTVWRTPGRVQGQLGDPANASLDGTKAATGVDGGDTWIEIVPKVEADQPLLDNHETTLNRGLAFAMGGRGDSTYAGNTYYRFLVDLGGNDTYRFPRVGASTNQVTLLLDVGDGNDTYSPTGDDPSLGAATGGVAVLADAGGRNWFNSTQAVTQGAATGQAVGILVTWNATNRFESSASDVAQGSARAGGVGILVSFGKGDDAYVTGSSGLAQGAASSAFVVGTTVPGLQNRTVGPIGPANVPVVGPTTIPAIVIPGTEPITVSQVDHSPGFGILLDDGGNNRYLAPNATASQGVAFGPGSVGILWSGSGDDWYVAGNSSQGSGIRGGVGILIDSGGDDAYDAPGGTRVQGAGNGGTGLLLDLGGNERYLAKSIAQGFGSNPGGLGILLDLSGRDFYTTQAGQGASDCLGGAGVFVDAQGQDRYVHGGVKRRATSSPDAPDSQDNNWTWMQPTSVEEFQAEGAPPAKAACLLGVGVDSDTLGDAMVMVRDRLASPTGGGLEVELQVETAGETLTAGTGGRVAGNVTLRALVSGLEDEDQARTLRRVVFFFDDVREAEGRFDSFSDGIAVYKHEWTTTSGTFPDLDYPDRNYTVRASAFVDPDPTHASPVDAPDLPAYESGEVVARVDNGPFLGASLSKAGVFLTTAILTPGGEDALLDVTLGGDLEWPLDATGAPFPADEECEGGQVPGGNLTINATGSDGTVHTVLAGYCPAGTYGFSIDATTDGQPWDDGQYDLLVEVKDADGKPASRSFTIQVDALAPTSSITTPSLVGLDRVASETLRLDWTHADLPFDGSGVEEVYVVQVDPATLAPIELYGPYDAGVTKLEEMTVGDGASVAFVTVAVDAAGNSESPCRATPPENPLSNTGGSSCYRAKAALNTTVIKADLSPPNIDATSMTRPGLAAGHPANTAVHPEDPVSFTANVDDSGSGVHKVLIQFFDSTTGQETHSDEMVPGTGTAYRYDTWNLVNHDDHDDYAGGLWEGLFSYTVTAFDEALNERSVTAGGILDSWPPRVNYIRTEYLDASGAERDAGGPGSTAVITVDVDDIMVAGLTVDTRDLGLGAAAFPCNGPVGETRYVCTVPLSGVADGTYSLRLDASDAAGNHNDNVFADVLVSGQPLDIEGLEILRVGHDSFTVNWTTSEPGTSIVEFGRLIWPDDEAAPQSTRFAGPPTENHTVVVTGLSPSSKYFVRAVSDNAGGIRNESAFVAVTTLNAYRLDLSSLDGGRILRDEVSVGYGLAMRTPGDEDPVSMRILVQDAGKVSSPVEVAPVFQQGPGQGAFTLDTTRFADGAYRVIAELDRLGDFNRTVSPEFRIDNTAPIVTPIQPRPGSAVATARPLIEVALLDPLGHAPVRTDALEVRIGGVNATVASILSDTVSPSGVRRVTFNLTEPVANGHHLLNVSVADLAGNRDWTAWPFEVDVLPPSLEGSVNLTFLPGPAAARPGGRLRIAVDVDDASGVAEAQLDTTRMQGQAVALASVGGRRWEIETVVPADAQHGSHVLPLVAKDALGNEGVLALVDVTVDATPATVLQVLAKGTGFLNTTVHLSTDEATIVFARNGTLHDGAWGLQHTFTVDGLTPGMRQTILLDIVDGAGHVTAAEIAVSTREDVIPPTAPGDLASASTQEGVVTLTWAPASDNSAVSHYVVERDATPRALPMRATVNQTGFQDLDAPAGRDAVYRVMAVDAAGLVGPPAQVAVHVLALPHLSQATVTPLRAKTTEPVTFQVEYRHASGKPADAVWVQSAGTTHALALAGAEDCHDGCLYQARVRLPPTSQMQNRAREVTFFADAGAHQARLVTTDVPIVVLGASDGGAAADHVAGAKGAPGPGTFTVFIALLAAAAACRQSVHERRTRK